MSLAQNAIAFEREMRGDRTRHQIGSRVRRLIAIVERSLSPHFLMSRRLKGRAADAANAVLSAVGDNFRRILAWLRALLRFFLIAILSPSPSPAVSHRWCQHALGSRGG